MKMLVDEAVFNAEPRVVVWQVVAEANCNLVASVVGYADEIPCVQGRCKRGVERASLDRD